MNTEATAISISEAIDRAGPVLFGSDWINRLKPQDAKILSEYGPKPYGQPRQSIGPCPRQFQAKLDRAMGRDARLVVQRATVLDWIFSARVMTATSLCDPAALSRVLARYRPTKPDRGAPPRVRHRLITQMLEDVRSGKWTVQQLEKMKQEAVASAYGATRKACHPARVAAVAEAKRRGLG